MRAPIAAALVAALSLLVGCSRSDQGVARVNGQPVQIEPAPGTTAATPRATRADAERAVDRHLAALEAQRRGLSKGSNSEKLTVQDEEHLRDALFRSIRDSVALTPDDLQAHYEKTKLSYMTRQVILRKLACASEAEARELDLRLGPDGRLDPRAETIGPAPVEALPTSVLPEALSLRRVGERAAVQRDGRWSLVELEEIRSGEPLPFDAVRPRVEASLRLLRAQAAYQDQIETLRRNATVEINSLEAK